MLTEKKENGYDVLSKYYALSEHWKSDFDFYHEECQFLSSLVNKYFVFLLEGMALSEIQKLAAKLSVVSKTTEDIRKSINDYMGDIKAFIALEEEYRFEVVLSKHIKLERRISDYVKSFKKIKGDVFLVTEEILHNEKPLQMNLSR